MSVVGQWPMIALLSYIQWMELLCQNTNVPLRQNFFVMFSSKTLKHKKSQDAFAGTVFSCFLYTPRRHLGPNYMVTLLLIFLSANKQKCNIMARKQQLLQMVNSFGIYTYCSIEIDYQGFLIMHISINVVHISSAFTHFYHQTFKPIPCIYHPFKL